MTIQMALDSANNDLIISPSGGIERVKDGRYVVQLVRNKLRTWLGEWRLDPRKGWVAFADFDRDYDLFDLEMRARAVIMSVADVKEVTTMSLAVKDRKLQLDFEATTTFGEIKLNIPWG